MAKKKIKKVERQAKRKARKIPLDLIALSLIVIYAIAYSLIFLGGPSFYGDDTAYLGEAYFVMKGIFQESSYIFSIRLLQFFPIAFFYQLFGISMLTSSLWDIISFIGSIIITFFIGKKLYNSVAGLIGAFALTFMPNVAILAPTISDNVTAMFFVGLTLIFFIYGADKKSRLYYFLSGLFFVWGILITPETFLIDLVIALFVLLEIIRGRVKLDKSFLFAVYGILTAYILLMLFNYANCGNPLITLEVNSKFYSNVGGTQNIPSTNIDPRFYLNTMFPYNLFNNIIRGNLSFNYIVNSFSGFFFYALVVVLFILPIIKTKGLLKKLIYIVIVGGIAVVYLTYLVPVQRSLPCTSSVIGPDCPMKLFYITFIPFIILLIEMVILRKDAIYPVFFIFIFGLLLLNYGPMSISIHPFKYLITYRLERFLAVLGIPIAASLGIALAEIINSQKRKISRLAMIAAVVILLAFLAYTSFKINVFYYNTLAYLRYDQLAIANYLLHYPSTTKIYFVSSFSNVPIYMRFENLSRFFAYDSIQNCSEIPNGSFVIVPKYVQVFGLKYTPNPEKYCPNWKLVFYPKYPYLTNNTIISMSAPFGAKLYLVPGKNITPINVTPTTTVTAVTTVPTTSITASPTIFSNFNYFNLTGVGYINPITKQLENFTVINNVENVTVSLNKSSASPGEYVGLNVIFVGEFKWYKNLATSYYLNQTVHVPLINFHYYGVELANQTGMLLVQNNGPWYNYITQIGEPHQLIYKDPSRYLLVHWVITPNPSMVGKTLKFCGGYFATYSNTTLMGGFGSLYNYLAYTQTSIINNTVINLQSKDCALLNVT
ncbi:MAG: glycosyltransferase family 39 protein [Candidatus Micrarchaeia archaeon]